MQPARPQPDNRIVWAPSYPRTARPLIPACRSKVRGRRWASRPNSWSSPLGCASGCVCGVEGGDLVEGGTHEGREGAFQGQPMQAVKWTYRSGLHSVPSTFPSTLTVHFRTFEISTSRRPRFPSYCLPGSEPTSLPVVANPSLRAIPFSPSIRRRRFRSLALYERAYISGEPGRRYYLALLNTTSRPPPARRILLRIPPVAPRFTCVHS